MSHRKNTISLSTVTAHLLVASFALLFCSCLPSSADAFQLTPTSALSEEDRVSAWNESDEGEATVANESSLGFLETGELPQSIDQLRAMQVRFKSLAEQVKDATVSITMRTGQGTGVLVSSDGVILTAAHVIGGPRRGALITFRDGQRARAVTLGVEAGTDSGMLKIMEMLENKPDTETKDDEQSKGAEDIAPGELPAPGESTETDNEEAPGGDDVLDQELSQSETDSADSEEDIIVKAFASEGLPFFEYLDVGVSTDLEEGQWVMAVGHPGGLDEERGMVVRVGRIINRNATSLRTDCTLVGGDSGGPLVNMEGNVVAIHSRIGGRIQDNIHVPVNVFLDTWEKLASGFKIGEQGRLGLSVSSDSNIVSDVQKGGPADKAGIQVGDILSGIGAQNVNNKRSLTLALQGRFPYEKLPIRVIRGSQKVDLTAMLVDTELLEAIKRRQMFLKSRKLQRER